MHWPLLTVVSCHIRFIFLAYPRSTRRYGLVDANGSWFGIIMKEILTFKVSDVLVILFNWEGSRFLELNQESHVCGWDGHVCGWDGREERNGRWRCKGKEIKGVGHCPIKGGERSEGPMREWRKERNERKERRRGGNDRVHMTRDPTPATMDGEVVAKMILSSRPIDPSINFTPKIRKFALILQNPHRWVRRP